MLLCSGMFSKREAALQSAYGALVHAFGACATEHAELMDVPDLYCVLDIGVRPRAVDLLCRRLMILSMRDILGLTVGGISRVIGLSLRNTTRNIKRGRWLVENDPLYGEVFAALRAYYGRDEMVVVTC